MAICTFSTLKCTIASNFDLCMHNNIASYGTWIVMIKLIVIMSMDKTNNKFTYNYSVPIFYVILSIGYFKNIIVKLPHSWSFNIILAKVLMSIFDIVIF